MVYIQELLKLRPKDVIIDGNIALFLMKMNKSNSHMLGSCSSK